MGISLIFHKRYSRNEKQYPAATHNNMDEAHNNAE
jgi:hypothetical protein